LRERPYGSSGMGRPDWRRRARGQALLGPLGRRVPNPPAASGGNRSAQASPGHVRRSCGRSPWTHVHLVGDLDAVPPVVPHVMVWRSVRAGGDTETRKSRRTLALPARCVEALRAQRVRQDAAAAWQGS
jgi:hypothetical protein